jgi:hypothetical protein
VSVPDRRATVWSDLLGGNPRLDTYPAALLPYLPVTLSSAFWDRPPYHFTGGRGAMRPTILDLLHSRRFHRSTPRNFLLIRCFSCIKHRFRLFYPALRRILCV